MRLKKVKNADEIIKTSIYTIDNPKQNIGKYKEIYNKNIHIEIGSGKGDFIYNMAKTYNDTMFIAIEKYPSVLYKLALKLQEEPLSNLKLMCEDANNIDEIFQNEIDTLYLNFSDPWPKTRHHKRRLTSDIFLNKYEKIFSNQNHIIMKTDNRDLFEYSIIKFVEHNYKIKDISLDLHKTDKFNIETEYEKKFAAKGYPIYMIEVYK